MCFVLPEGRLNSSLVDHVSQNNPRELLRLADTLASQKKPRNRTCIPAYVCVSVRSLMTKEQAAEVLS